jgi:hypothetical protein
MHDSKESLSSTFFISVKESAAFVQHQKYLGHKVSQSYTFPCDKNASPNLLSQTFVPAV